MIGMLTCQRCNHEWIQRATGNRPKRCPKCKSYLWMTSKGVDGLYPGKVTSEILQQEVKDRDHIIEGKNKIIEQLTAERLPPLLVTDPLGKAEYDKLPIDPIVTIPSKMYAPLKSILMLATRDKSPEIKLQLKDNEIVEIL